MKNETPNPIKISIIGNERFDFIQNLITNNLKKINKTLYSYILTPQGKILYEVQIDKFHDSYDMICTNDQMDLYNYLNTYSKLSEVLLKKVSIDSIAYSEDYLLKLFKSGRIDSNFLKNSSYAPSEIHDEYIDYEKGCYIGQEVVSRIKHRQLIKKNIKIFEQTVKYMKPLSSEFNLLLELDKYKILRLDVGSNYQEIQDNFGIKVINP